MELASVSAPDPGAVGARFTAAAPGAPAPDAISRRIVNPNHTGLFPQRVEAP